MNTPKSHLDENVIASFCADERIMPARAFAALIGVKPDTEIQMRARRQTPPFFKSGAAAFYRFDDVAEWLQQQRFEAERGYAGKRQAVKDMLS